MSNYFKPNTINCIFWPICICIDLHTVRALIYINICNFLIYCVIIFVIVFANISLNNCICINIRPFIVNLNIVIFVFVFKNGIQIYICLCIRQKIPTQKYLYPYLPKTFNQDICVLIFGPENDIRHTLVGFPLNLASWLPFEVGRLVSLYCWPVMLASWLHCKVGQCEVGQLALF